MTSLHPAGEQWRRLWNSSSDSFDHSSMVDSGDAHCRAPVRTRFSYTRLAPPTSRARGSASGL